MHNNIRYLVRSPCEQNNHSHHQRVRWNSDHDGAPPLENHQNKLRSRQTPRSLLEQLAGADHARTSRETRHTGIVVSPEPQARMKQLTGVGEHALSASPKLAGREKQQMASPLTADHAQNEARVPTTVRTSIADENVADTRFHRSYRSSSPVRVSNAKTSEASGRATVDW